VEIVMPRYFSLGNSQMLICMDEHGQIRDFYFPHVGQENHVNGKIHKFGVWVDGIFSWIDSPDWKKKLTYQKETLVSKIKAFNKNLQLELTINDYVHHTKNIYMRTIHVTNKADKIREIKLFCHQKFDIFGLNIGNTTYYNPIVQAVVHYKGKRYFLADGTFYDRYDNLQKGICGYAVGASGELGKEGTYVDAEDGELSGNTIEHGSTDATLYFSFRLAPKDYQDVNYWICAGKNLKEVSQLNEFILHDKTPQELMTKTASYWKRWVNKTKFNFFGLDDSISDLFKRSLLIIHTHVDKGGAIIASGDSALYFKLDTYSYMWPRDGALIVRSLDRAGYKDLTEKFFAFCCNALTPDGYLFHKYNPDGSFGSSWHSWIHEGHIQLPIQEDQIALVLDALWKHFVQYSNRSYIEGLFKSFIRPIENFMLTYIDKEICLPKESYDLWEEKLGVHTFTCATVYAGLQAAARFEEIFGTVGRAKKCRQTAEDMKNAMLELFYDEEKQRFIKGIYYDGGKIKKDMTEDASNTYGIFEYKVLDINDSRVQNSMKSYIKNLHCHCPAGGYTRYVYDLYHRIDPSFPGNPWFITTLWLAEYYIIRARSLNDLQPAIELFTWVKDRALETGILAEQINPYTGAPLSVSPLTWSHAAFVIAINKYLEKLDELGICEMCNPPQLQLKSEQGENND